MIARAPMDLPFPLPPAGRAPDLPSLLRARDGSVLRWGAADMPGPLALVAPGTATPLSVAVSPVRPGNTLAVEYRVDGGPVRQVIGVPEPRAGDTLAQVFRAVLPGQAAGLVEFLPVLRFAGQPVSPRLLEASQPSHYRVASAAAAADPAATAAPADGATAGHPRWAWDAKFVGALTAFVRKEMVGVTPDGLRINWHVTEGTFVGPGLEGIVLPGAADWMRIRRDGVGIVSVQACFQTQTGARIYGCYGGMFDLGPDGYARALRGEYDPLPPVVVAPTYATAEPELQWLNRLQCMGIGRVDMKALRVEFDVYTVQVAGRKDSGQIPLVKNGY